MNANKRTLMGLTRMYFLVVKYAKHLGFADVVSVIEVVCDIAIPVARVQSDCKVPKVSKPTRRCAARC